MPSSKIRVALLRMFGARISNGVVIKPNVNIKSPWLLSIGQHTWIGESVWIDNLVQTNIGANACLSQGCMLLTGNHNYKSASFDLITGEINVEDGCWVGAKAVVLPGTKMESCSILTVGSVAGGVLQANGIFKGNPAQFIRSRS